MSRPHSRAFAAVTCLGLLACTDITTGADAAAPTGGDSGAPAQRATTLRKVDGLSFCNRLVGECGAAADVAACQTSIEMLRVSQDCINVITDATCDVLKQVDAFTEANCFLPCTSTAPACNGDGTLKVCSESKRAINFDCEATCARSNQSWSGVCGDNYNGQASDDGQQKCFCR